MLRRKTDHVTCHLRWIRSCAFAFPSIAWVALVFLRLSGSDSAPMPGPCGQMATGHSARRSPSISHRRGPISAGGPGGPYPVLVRPPLSLAELTHPSRPMRIRDGSEPPLPVAPGRPHAAFHANLHIERFDSPSPQIGRPWWPSCTAADAAWILREDLPLFGNKTHRTVPIPSAPRHDQVLVYPLRGGRGPSPDSTAYKTERAASRRKPEIRPRSIAGGARASPDHSNESSPVRPWRNAASAPRPRGGQGFLTISTWAALSSSSPQRP